MSELRAPARHMTRRGGPLAVLWLTLAAFLAVLAVLALQLAGGRDPALRARTAATPLPPRRVLIRRVYERRVIIHIPPSTPAPPASSSQQASGAEAYPAMPVTRASGVP